MPDNEIKSAFKARNNFGQNGDACASSLTPGEKKSPIADVAPPQANVPSLSPGDQLSARVKMGDDGKAAEITTHPGMSHRGPSSGSPGGTITTSKR